MDRQQQQGSAARSGDRLSPIRAADPCARDKKPLTRRSYGCEVDTRDEKQGGRDVGGDVPLTHAPNAYTPLAPIFDTLRDMSDASHTYLQTAEPRDTPPGRLDLAIFNRMINALKAATKLLENGHWEFASPIVRHLFEMALNAEHLYSFADRDAAVFRFVKFGTLQKIVGEIEELEYRKSTGRAVDQERLQRLYSLTEGFGEFRAKDRADGTRRWRESWSGKTTRALAEASEHRMREAQYRMLFRGEWSEQTHGSPVTYLDGVFRTVSATWAEDVLAGDLFRIAQTAMLLQTLYLELWRQLDSIPNPDAAFMLAWSEAVADSARSLAPAEWDEVRGGVTSD